VAAVSARAPVQRGILGGRSSVGAGQFGLSLGKE